VATLYAKAAGGNWSAAGTWSTTGSGGGDSSGPPSASTDVIFELGSGGVTINATSSCRSLDTTSGTGTFGGTLTHGAFNLAIGDGTAGAGNVALKLNSGMTYSRSGSSSVTATFSFVSTSATLQTIDSGGKSLGSTTFNGSTGNWAFTTAWTMDGVSSLLTLTTGTLHLDGAADNSGLTHTVTNCVWTAGTLTPGTSTINVIGTNSIPWSLSSGCTLTANTGTIALSGAGSHTFNSGGKTTYNTVTFSNGHNPLINTASTFANITKTCNAGTKTDFIAFINTTTVTGTLKIWGGSATDRILVRSNTIGTATTITNTGATMDWQSVDFRDIALSTAYDASAITGLSGDSGGNTNITFPGSVAQVWSGTSGGNWSANAWTTRVPLPQDDVSFNTSLSGQTITLDMPRLGRSVDFSGVSGTPAISANTVAMTVNGSMNLTGIGTFTTGSTGSWTYMGRGSYSLTSNGKSYGSTAVSINAPTGTYTLLDAHTQSTGNGNSTFSVSNGTFDSAGFNVTATIISLGTGTTTNMGNSTWLATHGSSASVYSVNAGATVNAGTSTLVIGSSTANLTFAGGGKTYNDFRVTPGLSGTVAITGANTFNRIYSNGGGVKSIILPGSATTTLLSGLGLNNGTDVITFTASAGSATVSKASGILSWDYVNLTNIPSTGGATFYAGANSTDGGGNTGWIFSAAPAGAGRRCLMGVGQ
jgi:hypothetical protein